MTNKYNPFEDIEKFNLLAGNETLPRNLRDTLPQIYLRLVDEECTELHDAYEEFDGVEVVDACADIIVVAAGLLLSLGYDPEEIMKEVNSSNLSKFCKNEQEAIDSVASYLDDPRYMNVHYVKKGDVYVILGEIPGMSGYKILKNVNYRAANFSQFVQQKEENL